MKTSDLQHFAKTFSLKEVVVGVEAVRLATLLRDVAEILQLGCFNGDVTQNFLNAFELAYR